MAMKTNLEQPEQIEVYVTKYALTSGVFRCNGEACEGTTGHMIRIRCRGFAEYFHGADWHTTEAAAKARVLDMIDAKKTSLHKQLAKLEQLSLSIAKDGLVSK